MVFAHCSPACSPRRSQSRVDESDANENEETTDTAKCRNWAGSDWTPVVDGGQSSDGYSRVTPPTGACLATQATARRMGGRHELSSHVYVSALRIVLTGQASLCSRAASPHKKGTMVGWTAAGLHVSRRLRYLSMHRLGSLVMYCPGVEVASPPRSTRVPRVVSPSLAGPLPCALRPFLLSWAPPAPHIGCVF